MDYLQIEKQKYASSVDLMLENPHSLMPYLKEETLQERQRHQDELKS